MNRFSIFFIILFILSLLNLHAQNQPKLVDMSDKIPGTGTQVTLSDVQNVGNTLWISCSSSAVILRSTDGGNTFTAPVTASATQAIYMFPDATNGWAVGHAKGNKTTDGGQTWSNPNTTIGGTLYDVYFPTSSVGYAVGNSGAIYKTENSGTNWTLKTQPLNASVLSVAFPNSSDSNIGYIALSNAISTIYKTTNGGDSWTIMTLSGISSSMNCLKFIDDNTGWAAGGYGEIFSYKSGRWTKQTSPVTTTLNGISFASDGLNGWAVGNGGVMLHTTNGGSTWIQEGIGLTTQNLTKVDAVSATEAYIIGYGKTFIKYTTDYNMTGINPGMISPDGFEVYPNPFKQTATISWQLPTDTHVVLKVYDFTGHELKTLVDCEQAKGEHKINFDATGLPSGIYFYQLQAYGRIKLKKMIVSR